MAGITFFLWRCDQADYLRRFVTKYFITVWNASRSNDHITGTHLLGISVNAPSHPAGSDEYDVCFFVGVIASTFICVVVDNMDFAVIEHHPFALTLSRDEFAIIGDIGSVFFPSHA